MTDSECIKACTTCGYTYPLSGFHRNASKPGGRQSQCKVCVSAYKRANAEYFAEYCKTYNKIYYAANREKLLEDAKRYREENRERLADYDRQRWPERREESNRRRRLAYLDPEVREADNERRKLQYYENHERELECRKRYSEENKERLAEYAKQWREENKEYVSTYNKKYREREAGQIKRRAAQAKRKALKKGAKGEVGGDTIFQMAEDQEWLCAYCETPLFGEFHVDHMRPLSKGGAHDWSNLSITCPGCNMSKHTKTAEEFIDMMRKKK